MPQVGETKRIGASIFMWDGTQWIARKVNTALQGRTQAPVSPVATAQRPDQPVAQKPQQTEEEWFRDVPAAGGGAAAKARSARQRRVYGEDRGSAGVAQGFVSPRMRQAHAVFALDAGQALPSGGTRTKTGMGIGPVVSSGAMVKARRQAEAEGALRRERIAQGLPVELTPQQELAAKQDQFEAEQRAKIAGEQRGFERDVAMEGLRTGARQAEQEAGRAFDWQTMEQKRTWEAEDHKAAADRSFELQQMREEGMTGRLTQADIYRNERMQRSLSGRGYLYSDESKAAMQKLKADIEGLQKDQTLDPAERQQQIMARRRELSTYMPERSQMPKPDLGEDGDVSWFEDPRTGDRIPFVYDDNGIPQVVRGWSTPKERMVSPAEIIKMRQTARDMLSKPELNAKGQKTGHNIEPSEEEINAEVEKSINAATELMRKAKESAAPEKKEDKQATAPAEAPKELTDEEILSKM